MHGLQLVVLIFGGAFVVAGIAIFVRRETFARNLRAQPESRRRAIPWAGSVTGAAIFGLGMFVVGLLLIFVYAESL